MSGSFFSELKRRNVLRVAMAYAAAAWLLVQIAETVMPLYGFSDDAVRTVVTVLAVGFVPVVILAWVFERTPEGIQTDEAAQGSAPRDTRWLDRGIIVTLLIAVTYFAVDKYLLQPEPTHYGDKSIAVLPFDNLSDDPAQDYFGLGIAEEMLNLLSRIPELRVISRTSSFELDDQGLEIPEIAERLDVAHVLEGSVRRAGNQLRITAQLLDGATDTHIWSDTWDRELDDVFAIQDEIADEVVQRLEVIIAGEMPRSVRTDPLAWDLLLQSRAADSAGADRDPFRALELAQQALEHDPDYIPAVLQLNVVAWQLANYWPVDAEEMFRIERQAYAHAVEIAPDHPEVLARRAWEEFEIHNNWQRAAELAERAVSIAPGEVRVLYVAANLAHLINSFDISARFRKRMLEIDPLCIDCVYGMMRGTYVSRRYDEALEWHAKYKDMGGDGGHFTLTKIHLHRGEPALALQAAERMEKRFAGDAVRAMALYSLGREDEARRLLRQVDDEIYRNNAQAFAEAWAWIGDVEEAFAALEAAYGDSDYKHFFIRANDPVYDNIRADPRWQAALARVKLTEEQRAAIRYNPQLPD
jgi:TolB-like protein